MRRPTGCACARHGSIPTSASCATALHLAPNLEWVPQGAFADYANTTRTRGYALIGLTAGATLRSGIDVFLDLRNIGDKKAVGDISAVLTAAASSVIYYPFEGRAAYGGVRMRF